MPLTMLRVDTIHGRIPIETATSSHNMPQHATTTKLTKLQTSSFIIRFDGRNLRSLKWARCFQQAASSNSAVQLYCELRRIWVRRSGWLSGWVGAWLLKPVETPEIWRLTLSCGELEEGQAHHRLHFTARCHGHWAVRRRKLTEPILRYCDYFDFDRFWEIWHILTTDLAGLPGDLTWCSSRQSSVTGVPGVLYRVNRFGLANFCLHFCRSTSLVVDFVAGSAAALMQFIAVQWQWHNDIKWGPRYTLQCANCLNVERDFVTDSGLDTSWHWRCQGVAKSGRTWLDTRMHTGM